MKEECLLGVSKKTHLKHFEGDESSLNFSDPTFLLNRVHFDHTLTPKISYIKLVPRKQLQIESEDKNFKIWHTSAFKICDVIDNKIAFG